MFNHRQKAIKNKDALNSPSTADEANSKDDNKLNIVDKKEFDYPFIQIDSFFGEYEILNGGRRKWSCIARKNSLLYCINRQTFNKMFT